MSKIQPLRAFASSRARTISAATRSSGPAIRISSCGAEIGAPVDVDARWRERRERRARVEHHDDVVDAVREPIGEQARGGDQHRPADAVERDPVAGGERVQGADPGDHLVVEHAAESGHHGERRLVERGVAPDEERPGLAVSQMLVQRGAPLLGALLAPQADRRGVVRGLPPRTRWIGELDRAVRAGGAVAGDDLPAQGDELVGAVLGHDEQHVEAVQCLDGLDRDVVRVAGADADQQQPRARSALACLRVQVAVAEAARRRARDRR